MTQPSRPHLPLHELQRSNEELQRFAYAAAHDLRSPLRAVGALIELVIDADGHTLSRRSQQDLADARRRIDGMHQLLRDMLENARATHRLVEGGQHIDTGVLVAEVIALLDRPAGVRVGIDAELPSLRGSRAALELVFRNLLANAFKHVDPAQGRVRIRGERCGRHCEFRVIDDGPGIPDEHKHRVFDPFVTLYSGQQVGPGLGLALARRCVHNNGGAIRVEDTPGGGATLIFSWLAAPPRPAPAPTEANAHAPAADR